MDLSRTGDPRVGSAEPTGETDRFSGGCSKFVIFPAKNGDIMGQKGTFWGGGAASGTIRRSAAIKILESSKNEEFGHTEAHSHSIVAGGLELMS